MYFESHAHYDDIKFNDDRYELLNSLPEYGIDYVINAGADMKSSLAGIKLAEKYPYLYAAVGVHPHDAENMIEDDIKTLENYSSHEKIVAIGEIGLDFYYDNSPRDIQRYWFKRQLQLALELNMPVIIHSRDAAQECFDIIKESGVHKGVIHAYSGSPEMAWDYINMGFYIGVGGIITFKNARKLIEVVDSVPLDKILIETDSPYLSPVPLRGTRNNSQNLKYITDKIAQVKQIKPEEVALVTKKNGIELFNVK